MRRTIRAADLFCGAGGTSLGLSRACESRGQGLELLAVNHWEVAVETHAANHPWADHRCVAIDQLDPVQATGGKLDVLVASPECTHFSSARGGRPMSDQKRASGWHVVHWAERLRPSAIIVENVREFLNWGPVGKNGRPLKSRRGVTFRAWVTALESLGYTVDWRLLTSADHGDPTTRTRLFVVARLGRSPISWPDATHAQDPGDSGLKPWETARGIIEWDYKGSSIFGRKRPLAEKTLARIAAGLERFGGADGSAEPFLAILRGTSSTRSLDRLAPALTASGEHVALVEPFVLSQQSGGAPRSVRDPLPTVSAKGAIQLVEPFLVPHKGERPDQPPRSHSIDEPAPTVCATGPNFSLVEPFILPYYGNATASSIDRPTPTVTTKDRHALVEPTQNGRLDILFRMLTPRELARAQGFPDGYHFAGTRTDTVRQIGNAVSVNLAEALCSAVLS